MVSIDTIRTPIKPQLEEFDAFVRSCFGGGKGLLGQMLEYVLSSRGKGLRPTIVLLTAALHSAGGVGRRTHLAALMTEMIHLASLIHDDVIDSSDLRRGRASVNALWQSHNAVLVGDYILSRTMEIGMSSGQYDLVSHIIRAVSILCEGEIMQGDHASRIDASRDAYFEIIYKKTATLIGVSASAGALSAGASAEKVDAMRRFGDAVGMAFQIGDDILDYTASSSVTGKPSLGDLREGKVTLPLIEVIESADEALRNEILAALPLCADDENKREFVRSTVIREGGVERAREVMKSYLGRAMSLLAPYEPSPVRDALVQLCAYVAERER